MFNVHLLLTISVVFYFLSLPLVLLKREKAGFTVLCAGFTVHTAYQILRGWLTGIFIAGGMFEGVFLMPWALACGIIFLKVFTKEKIAWGSSTLLVYFFGILALVYPKGIIPPTPNKLTIFAHLFFITEVTGQACFYLGAWFAALYLVKKSESEAFHSLIVWGFVLFSIAQITGAIWAYMGWGSTFRWGSRHLQSAVIWCYFAAYLHLKFLPKWGTRGKAWFAAAGLIIVAVCSFGSYINEMKFPRIGG